MRFQIYLLLIFSMFAFSVCGGSEEPNTSSNKENEKPVTSNTSPVPSPSKQGSLDQDISTPTPVPTVEAVTLKPLIDSFCKARRAKDEAALRKQYSAATLKNLIAAAQAEGKKTITEYLEAEPVGEKCNIVNERIVGNTGEATFSTESYPNGITWNFVKENGEWKLTDQSSDFDMVKKAAQ